MFYDHLSAPGVRAKDLIHNFAIIGAADSGKCRCITPEGTWGGGGIPVVPTIKSLILVPPDPRRRSSKFLNVNWWKGYCYLLIMVPRVGDGDPSFRSTPIGCRRSQPKYSCFVGCLLLTRSSTCSLLLDLRPEAGYIFAPFGSLWCFKTTSEYCIPTRY